MTETYICLRELELKALEIYIDTCGGEKYLDIKDPIKVNISQFYAIEINDFAVAVGKTALWIAEEQMKLKTLELLRSYEFKFFPLKSITNSHVGNALTLDWESVLPSRCCDYIIGNPPFVGARNQSKEQKQEVLNVFKGIKNAGNIDYCGAWYMKCAKYIQCSKTRCALVSTNSICQGEQVANLWKPIYDMGVHIDFAHTTFRWNSESNDKAHVFCVIVGFSKQDVKKHLIVHKSPDDLKGEEVEVQNINAYLVNATNSFITSITKSLCNSPLMGIGSQPIDNGNYLFNEEEMFKFLLTEPKAKKFFHPWIGSNELMNGIKRYVLWLGDCKSDELRNLPQCYQRVLKVKNYRLQSKRKQTLKAAKRPQHFGTEIISNSNSIIVPETSSERRKLIPMRFVNKEIFCSNAVRLILDAKIYHFGVLQSTIHNAWVRVVGGRLKSDYRYSKDLVYNNFIWPGVTKETIDKPVEECVSLESREKIEHFAQEVLDARDYYTEREAKMGGHLCLADLYDPKNEDIYPKLIDAHNKLDKAVERAYGVEFNGNEELIVSHLFELYKSIVEE